MKTQKAYKVDLDYESFLFDPFYVEDSPASLKIIREFEYVYFLMNKDQSVLKNMKDYSRDYLHSLKERGFTIPSLDKEAVHFDYWWGRRHDVALERKLNSKITSAEVAFLKGWGFAEGIVTEDLAALKRHLKEHQQKTKWLIKRPHGFSGIGHYQFDSWQVDEGVLLKILQGPILLEPVYERVFDIGTTFVISDGIIQEQFMVENFNSKAGAFSGGAGCSSLSGFKKYIEEKYSYSLDELEETTKKIAECYLSMGADSNIQIDSFVYQEEGKLKLYPLVEVNYRKTMGLVIHSLAQKYEGAKWMEWRLGLRSSGALDVDFMLSPQDSRFHSGVKLHEK